MKIEYKDNGHKSNVQATKFSAKVDGKFFSAVFDKLYSNKINSTYREVWSNAHDAHVDAGIPDRPFKVKLPSTFDLETYCRDYGYGLSPEFMLTRYTVAFDSTKDDDDTAVGGFGIGRLSPLSYSNQYTVVSYYNKREYHYSITLNSLGEPECSLLFDTPTAEPSGLKVSFTANLRDISNFIAEANRVSLGFDVKPTADDKDLSWPTLTKVTEGKGYYFYSVQTSPSDPGTLGMSGSYAKMGCVFYPIPASYVKGLGRGFYRDVNIVLEFPLGSLEAAMSREALSFSDTSKTEESIRRKVKHIEAQLMKDFQDTLGRAKTLREAQSIYKGKPIVLSQKKFSWKGIELSSYMFKRDLVQCALGRNDTVKQNGATRVFIHEDIDAIVVSNTRKGERDLRPNLKIKNWLDKTSTVGRYVWVKLIETDPTHKATEDARVQELADYLDCTKVVYVKDMDDVKSKVSGYTPVSVKQAGHGLTYPSKVTLTEDQYKDGGLYLKTYQNNTNSSRFSLNGYKQSKNHEIISNMIELGLISGHDKIHLVPKPLWKKFEGSQWVEVSDVLEKFISDNKEEYEKQYLLHQSKIFSGRLRSVIPEVMHYDSKVRASQSTNLNVYAQILLGCFCTKQTLDLDTDLLYDRYPLIPYCYHRPDLCEDYVRLVNKANGITILTKVKD